MSGEKKPDATFEVLAYKLDTLLEGQEKVNAKLDELNDSLYEPNTGLFTRVKAIEVSQIRINESLHEHSNRMIADKAETRATIAMIKDEVKVVPELKRFKDKFSSASVWFMTSFCTVVLGTIGKLIYDFYVHR